MSQNVILSLISFKPLRNVKIILNYGLYKQVRCHVIPDFASCCSLGLSFPTCKTPPVASCYSKCSFMWQRVGKAKLQGPTPIYWLKVCILARSPDDLCAP